MKLIKQIRKKLYHNTLSYLIVLALITISIGTVFYHYIEGLRWIDALYFSVVTLTTVGYGDFSPKTDIGKLFTIVYIILGGSIIVGFINVFYEKRLEKWSKVKEKMHK